MNVLLDTYALLALARGDLPKPAVRALRSATEASVSIVSPWEVAIKVAVGKLRLREPPLQWRFPGSKVSNLNPLVISSPR